ncbi:MAG: hypothetical protein DRH08_00140 [Deltaproteobacteria bacterium]|nr:MAG: hypothetical protein DRH08_00140 [Deltaproteobacteria bacterium]
MPDFWDKLFKTNLGPDDGSFAIHGFMAIVTLYVIGEFSQATAETTSVDSLGASLTVAELVQFDLVLDEVDSIGSMANKIEFLAKINAAAMLAELGIIDKAAALALIGI